MTSDPLKPIEAYRAFNGRRKRKGLPQVTWEEYLRTKDEGRGASGRLNHEKVLKDSGGRVKAWKTWRHFNARRARKGQAELSFDDWLSLPRGSSGRVLRSQPSGWGEKEGPRMGERYPQGMDFPKPERAPRTVIHCTINPQGSSWFMEHFEDKTLPVLKEDDGLQGHPQAIIQKILRKAQGY